MRYRKQQKIGLFMWQECAKCHADIGIDGVTSGALLKKDKTTICHFRKKNNLKTLSKSEAVKRRLTKEGVYERKENELGWEQEWYGVVETYWSDKYAVARMLDTRFYNMSEAMIDYYWNHESNKERSRLNAMTRYHARKTDSVYSVKRKLRNHIARVCRKSKTGKTRKTIEYLGCDINTARQHIQKQFKKGMTWDNHGTVWELDHVIPMALFDLSREDQRMRVNHFTNIRPEFVRYNRTKGDKMIGEHQIALL